MRKGSSIHLYFQKIIKINKLSNKLMRKGSSIYLYIFKIIKSNKLNDKLVRKGSSILSTKVMKVIN